MHVSLFQRIISIILGVTLTYYVSQKLGSEVYISYLILQTITILFSSAMAGGLGTVIVIDKIYLIRKQNIVYMLFFITLAFLAFYILFLEVDLLSYTEKGYVDLVRFALFTSIVMTALELTVSFLRRNGEELLGQFVVQIIRPLVLLFAFICLQVYELHQRGEIASAYLASIVITLMLASIFFKTKYRPQAEEDYSKTIEVKKVIGFTIVSLSYTIHSVAPVLAATALLNTNEIANAGILVQLVSILIIPLSQINNFMMPKIALINNDGFEKKFNLMRGKALRLCAALFTMQIVVYAVVGDYLYLVVSGEYYMAIDAFKWFFFVVPIYIMTALYTEYLKVVNKPTLLSLIALASVLPYFVLMGLSVNINLSFGYLVCCFVVSIGLNSLLIILSARYFLDKNKLFKKGV